MDNLPTFNVEAGDEGSFMPEQRQKVQNGAMAPANSLSTTDD